MPSPASTSDPRAEGRVDTRTELVLQQLEQLPTLPAVAVRVLEMTGENRASARDVVTLIESDPSLTARILRIVHRADGGLRGDMNSIERAVVFLGFEAVRNAALAVGVFETFGPAAVTGNEKSPAKGKRFDRGEFWKHCIAVACMAELLAEGRGQGTGARGQEGKNPTSPTSSSPTSSSLAPDPWPLTPSDAFVAGLLHDIGKVAIDAALPKSFARVIDAVELLRCDIADVERTVIGLDHTVVGKRLAERWMLPAMFRDVIWLHGQSPKALPENCRHPRLVNLVTLADVVVRQQHLGFSGNHAFTVPVPTLLEAVGLTAAQLDDAASQLVARIEPRAKMLGLGEATSEDLYRQALTQANRELGRMTDQLAMKNRKLATRAKFFETLSAFHDDLRPDSPPATVLFAIAQTATQALDAPCVAAFSLDAANATSEVMLVNAAGDVVHRGVVETSVDCRMSNIERDVPTLHIQQSTVDPGPILRADAGLEWLTSTISPRLAGANIFWIALKADGATIGGVVWGASGDEAARLATQAHEIAALAGGWGLALRTCQIREESRVLNEQLADANRRLTGAQEEIMRARMLASIGEMAAGAAHEMNNPLAVISGRSQLLALQLADAKFDPKHAANARLIAEQSQRLSDMITELMDFAKPTPPRPLSCNLSEVVNKALTQANASGELADRRVEASLADDLPAVLADASQVGSALAEVLVNAAQATEPNTGGITLSAAHDRYGGQVVLSVTDNGCGMDERTLIRAFDPFYSAKPAGRRRGMGLAKAMRWVEGSGGTMRLESKPGEGTRVVILLPADVARPAKGVGEQRIA